MTDEHHLKGFSAWVNGLALPFNFLLFLIK